MSNSNDDVYDINALRYDIFFEEAVSSMTRLGNIFESDNFNTVHELKKTQLEKLKKSYSNQNLVLVLGAGSSRSYGLPDWSTLLQKLLIKNLEEEPEESDYLKDYAILIKNVFSPNPLILARNIKSQYKNNYYEECYFEENVRSFIYEEISDNVLSPLFKEIREFCIAPRNKPNLDSIITFNYDDILENCLSQLGIEIPFKSIYSAGMKPKADELPIYHVHGFLPRNGKLDSKNKITLSEDLYHQLYTDIYCWSNIVQINKFTNNTCLFIGTSFTDPNLRRLLDIAKEQRGDNLICHYLFRKRYDKEETKNKISKVMSKLGKEIDDSEEELNRKTEFVINIMKKYEEEDALSFGVSIVWVDNYNEVPTILKYIRDS